MPIGSGLTGTHSGGLTVKGTPGTSASGGQMRLRSAGLLLRISPVKGLTPKAVLSRKIWLPAIINTFTITETALHNEYDTISAGQFSQPAMGDGNARQLRDTSLDTLILDFDPSWIVASGQDPYALRAALFEVMRSKQPIAMLMTFHPNPGPHPELSMDATIRSIEKDLQPGENDTRYFTIEYKEYRDPSAKRRSSNNPGTSRKKGVTLPTTVTLTATDTLYSLAQEFYGGYTDWRTIRNANGISTKFGGQTKIVTLGGRFKVGAKIKIPAMPHLTLTITGSS